MVKALWLRFEQGLVSLTMLFVEYSFETALFRDLFNYVPWRSEFWKHISYEGHHFLENIQNLT